MDFDFGNLIYIILTLVFVIFGAMNKKKKKVQTPQEVLDEDAEMEVEVEQPLSSVDEKLKRIFGDFVDIDEPSKVVKDQYDEEITEQEQTVYEPIPEAKYTSFDNVEEEKDSSVYRLSDHMDSIRVENAKSIISDVKQNPSFTQQLFKEFDPKKALLYSEIFKPKYF